MVRLEGVRWRGPEPTRDYWVLRARIAARKLVVKLGIRKFVHMPRIEAVCARYKIKIVRVALDGAAAQLVRTDDGIEIQVSDRIVDVGALRFAIAHELAHYMLGHPSLPPHRLGMRSVFVAPNGRDYEAEANAYASELLMPDFLVREQFDLDVVSMDLAWKIAAGSQLALMLIDDHDQKTPEPAAKKPANAHEVPPGSLENAFERARMRLSIADGDSA